MNVKPNIGLLDRYLRLTAGLAIYGSALSQQRSRFTKYALLSLGSMKVAEGIVGWCPLLALAGVSTVDERATQVQSAPSPTATKPTPTRETNASGAFEAAPETKSDNESKNESKASASNDQETEDLDLESLFT